MVQSEQHSIYRLMAGGRGPSLHGRNGQRKTAVSGSSRQLTLKKGTAMRAASQLPGKGPTDVVDAPAPAR